MLCTNMNLIVTPIHMSIKYQYISNIFYYTPYVHTDQWWALYIAEAIIASEFE